MTDKAKKTSVVKDSFENYSRVKKEYSKEQVNYIIKAVAPSLNPEECYHFIVKCEKLGVDPMSGDITAYISKAKNGDRKLVMIVGRNWKREQGMKNPHVKSVRVEGIYTVERTTGLHQVDPEGKKMVDLVPGSETKDQVRVAEWGGGKLWGAMCVIERDDYTEPFVVTVPFTEYKGYNVWATKPSTMIKKVAESQCWDLAVPELSRVYDESESFEHGTTGVQEADNSPATAEQIKTINTLRDGGGFVILSKEDTQAMTKSEAVEIIKDLSIKK